MHDASAMNGLIPRRIAAVTVGLLGLCFALSAQAQTTRLAVYGAIAPQARAGQVGGAPLTFFLRMINSTATPLTGCRPVFPMLPTGATYQTVNDLNQLTGTANTPADVAAGGQQGFLLAIPTATAASGGYAPEFQCTQGSSTLTPALGALYTISSASTPDVVAISATTSADGVARIATIGGAAAMAVAGVNIGAAGSVIVAPSSNAYLLTPAAYTVCETNAATGQCLAAPAAQVTVNYAAGQLRTFTVFAQAPANSGIPFWPDAQRMHLTFLTSTGLTVGDTSAAITAPAPDVPPGPGLWLGRFEEGDTRTSLSLFGVWPNGKMLFWGSNGIWGGVGSEWMLSLQGQFTPGQYAGAGNLFRASNPLAQSPLAGAFKHRLSFDGAYGQSTTGHTGRFRAVFDGVTTDYATSVIDLVGTYDVLNGVNSTTVIGEATIRGDGTWTGRYTVSGSTNCLWSGPFLQEAGRNFFTITQTFQGVLVNCPSTINSRTFTGFAAITALQTNGAEILNAFVTQETVANPSFNSLPFRLRRKAPKM